MSDPMPYATLLKVLRDEGLTVYEHKTDGRSPSEHNRNHKGAWGPIHGIVVHHTVTRGHDSTIEICRKGHATLPGPLCHGVICKQGHIHVVGYGRANHAGLGDDDVLRAVVNEKPLPPDNEANTDGNRHFYGFECENLGDGNDPWPAAQFDAIRKACAAICRWHGWSERSVIGHLEWQPGKVDPRGFSMDWMRDQIHDQITAGPGGDQEEEEEVPYAVARTNEDGFTLTPGEWKTVWFSATPDFEMDIDGGKKAYTLTAFVRLPDVPAGTTVQGRFYHQRPDGSRWSGPVVERESTSGMTFADFTHSGSIAATEKVRFELVAFPPADAPDPKVSAVYVRGLSWT